MSIGQPVLIMMATNKHLIQGDLPMNEEDNKLNLTDEQVAKVMMAIIETPRIHLDVSYHNCMSLLIAMGYVIHSKNKARGSFRAEYSTGSYRYHFYVDVYAGHVNRNIYKMVEEVIVHKREECVYEKKHGSCFGVSGEFYPKKDEADNTFLTPEELVDHIKGR